IESNTGAQLERVQVGARATSDAGDDEDDGEPVVDAKGVVIDWIDRTIAVKKRQAKDPWRAMEDAERGMSKELGVTLCLGDLAAVRYARQIRWPAGILQLHRQAPHRTQGELVVLVLRAFHERASESHERGLAEVYATMQRVAGRPVPDASELAQDFREGTKPRAKAMRTRASSLYTDALLILYEWCRKWRRTPREPSDLAGL